MFSLASSLPTTWADAVKVVDGKTSIDNMKKQAGMDWEIKSVPVQYTPEGTNMVATMPKKRLLYRDDTKASLAVVSDRFKVVQPGEVLEFYRELVDAGNFELETAGIMQGGRKFWALARTDMEMRVQGQDLLTGYLLLTTGCDGTLATNAFFTSIRATCLNMLNVMSANADEMRPRIRIPHSRHFNPEEVKSQLGILEGGWEQFELEINELSIRKVSYEEAVKYFMEVLYPRKKEIDLKREGTKLKKVFDVYENAPGQELKSARHTAWGLVNAVTRLSGHQGNCRSNDNRIYKDWVGSGVDLKQRAYMTAMKLVA